MGRMANKVALVTGAGSGIGKASAGQFVREGAKVIVADIDESLGRATERELTSAGYAVAFLLIDVTSEESVKAAVDEAAGKFGALHVLVNCAGGSIAADAAVTDVDMAVWDHTINLDLRGTFLVCRHAIPHMQSSGGGAIVNFTSLVALQGNFPGHVYTAAKGGIISFTQALAGRYWRDNIRANAIAPGVILSERVASRMGVDRQNSQTAQIETAMKASRSLIDEKHPFGYGFPEDIANVVLFLASDESRMVNGAVIPAEGGVSKY
ncbi:MAG: SDR family oxidoreductase [Chromatiales bacterium]|jgi:NAD(P)-dependent dehydrogenase (short-subunit alcohol dehydrogenase family)|nr:SDR family oxidoreductase [Chromatiales bacterium]